MNVSAFYLVFGKSEEVRVLADTAEQFSLFLDRLLRHLLFAFLLLL